METWHTHFHMHAHMGTDAGKDESRSAEHSAKAVIVCHVNCLPNDFEKWRRNSRWQWILQPFYKVSFLCIFNNSSFFVFNTQPFRSDSI